MTILAAQYSVTTGAALEITDGTAATVRQSYELLVKNTDATNPVYLGPTGVTSSTGYKLSAGEAVGISLAYGEKLFARATGGTVVVTCLQSKF